MFFTKSTLLAVAHGGLFQVQTVAGECARVVHCRYGSAYNNRNGDDFTSPTGKTCVEECAGECCTATDTESCYGIFSVCADGSCDGLYACAYLGDGGSAGLVSGPSCVKREACNHAGYQGIIGDITNGCDGIRACKYAGAFGGSTGDVSDACHGDEACNYMGSYGGIIGDISNESCVGEHACANMAKNGGVVGDISGGSCGTDYSCSGLGYSDGNVGDVLNGSCLGYFACGDAASDGAIGDISSSCRGKWSCQHLGYDNPDFGTDAMFPMDNCCNGESKCSEVGKNGRPFPDDACPVPTSSPTLKPTEDPTSDPTTNPSNKPSGTPTTDPSASPSGSPSSKPTADPTADPTTSPTDTPTSKPSGTPTPIPSVSPTESPTDFPTESPTMAPKFVVCGKGTGCRGGNVEPATESEVHPVRCCANTRLGAGWKKQEHCNVWASSLTRHCHEASFAKAWQLCDYAGARLCTATELADSCTIQSGCGFDGRLVWSSSPEVDLEKELQDLREELAQCRGDVQ